MDKKIQEALKVVDEVCAKFQGTRQDHVVIQQALQIILAVLDPPNDTTKVEVPKRAKPRDRKREGKK